MKVTGPHTLEQANDLCLRYKSLIGIEGYRKGVFRRTVSWIMPGPYSDRGYFDYITRAYLFDADEDEKMMDLLKQFNTDEYDVVVFMHYDEDVDEYLFEYYRLSEFLLRHPEYLNQEDSF